MDENKIADAWVLMVNTTSPENYADLIARGDKTIEVRDWSTNHRGLLIIAQRGKNGVKALAVVRMTECRKTEWSDVEAACLQSYVKIKKVRSIEGYFSWVFCDNTRIRQPFKVSVERQLQKIRITAELCPEYFQMAERC